MQVARAAGSVWWRPDGASAWRPLSAGAVLHAGDWVATGPGASLVELVYPGESSRLLVEAGTVLQIGGLYRPLASSDGAALRGEPGQEPGSVFRAAYLRLGSLWAYVSAAWDRLVRWEIATPSAVAGVRGTLFRLQVDEAGATRLYVHQGTVELRWAGGRRLVGPGGTAATGQPDPARLRAFADESSRRLKEHEGWPPAPATQGSPDGEEPEPAGKEGSQAPPAPPGPGAGLSKGGGQGGGKGPPVPGK